MVLVVATALTAFAGMALLVRSFGRHRPSRTTSDFYVASRAVSPFWNASAISSEYISAAAFLGTAGLVLAYGADMLWLPIGAAAGYVVLLALVTAPLRRSCAYTLSDFAEWRLESLAVRRAVSVCVVVIGWFYLLPQMHGAGVTLGVVTGLPAWAGWAFVTITVMAIVLSGGMRSITVVQAFQFWLKLMAVAVPAAALIAVWRMDGAQDPGEPVQPSFRARTTVSVDVGVTVDVTQPTEARVSGVVDGQRYAGRDLTLAPGEHGIAAGTRVTFPAGSTVPHAVRIPSAPGEAWATPFAGGRDHPLLATYSVLLSMLLGTMGLPHIAVRFYTNTCGRAARRTVRLVLVMLALFYLFPAIFGSLGRVYTPELLMTGNTDATILLLPHRMLPGLAGDFLTGLITAGAFAAFLSTAAGVVVALAGTFSQDVFHGGIASFRIGAVVAMSVPVAVVAWIDPIGSAGLVTIAFALSAASLCPLLVLGVWWRRLTSAGVLAGLAAGGGIATGSGLLLIFGGPRTGWAGALLAQPAIVAVPAGFLGMIAVSLATRRRIPRGVDRALTRLHLPEEVTYRTG